MNEQMRKKVMIWMASALLVSLLITILIPSLIFRKNDTPLPPKVFLPEAEKAWPNSSSDAIPPVIIPVYLSKEMRVDHVDLEQYVRGVVAAEMPVDFELEALKAQAIAARTYIVRRWMEEDRSNVPVEGAIVTDTVQHQAYLTDKELKLQWGSEAFQRNVEKLSQAIDQTKGKIITYQNKPIEATFFSTSNGYTENSEDYWSEPIPYLRSVASPWDKSIAPRFQETIRLSYKQFLSKLGLSEALPAAATLNNSKVTEYTEGRRIKKVSIGGQTFSGKEVREKLGLNSSHFQWKLSGKEVEITTTGYGHGVGMSQWGANGMAKEGKKAEEILKHYYTGVEIENYTEYSKLK
ncbi:stage II sporulation protein D [Paenibacillus sp. J2TS4]|uniref:stage II sporulation protein D n=1 Tax=Paenibacillus sp. J2TS4 TaxID=2807194 RepID=UPI001B1C0864|nr:stage II sporulation protein D [Paenibacillus sp. J2TS4]GIP35568.1 stage II sporulation protein D [Paenibacillus sp. J2TS4]